MRHYLVRWKVAACFAVIGLMAVTAKVSYADATIPTADINGSADNALIKRYEGSFIVSYDHRAYADFRIPLAPLKRSETANERDAMNNQVFRPQRDVAVEGSLTRLVYALPENRSPLEVLRNYQDVIVSRGGQVEFQCKRDECGGDPNRASYGGGGRMSLTQFFFYEADIKDAAHSNGACAVTSPINDQWFLAAKIPQGNEAAWVTVQTYQLNAGTYCKALNARTIAVVHILEPKARDQKMVVVKAEQMANTIELDGSISLYGIYFDTNEARLKPESEPTLREIAALLGSQSKLAVLVIGHTDNQGSFEHNLDLSTRRANAVKAALIAQHGADGRRLSAAGAGMMAPVASNATNDGRAKNRRVTIVKAN
jgi:outer membrane protein OmpA-like peptidoglycan-associated protein